MIRITSGSRGAALMALVGLSTGLAMFGCSSADTQGTEQGSESTGTVGLELQAGGVTLNAVNYTILGNGFSKSGSINVANSTKISATIGGIPGGNGYSITLTGNAAGNGVTCTGSASFNVTAGATTSTQINLQCKLPPKTGNVSINGTVNVCPTIDSLSIEPAETTVGSSVTLSASGSDSDNAPSALSYAWSATGGTLTGATTANASLACTTAGPVTVTLTVGDGDCTDTLSQTVTCSPAPGGGSGGAGGGGGASSGGTGGSAGGTSTVGKIVFNEAESNGGIPGDWAELFNVGSAPIDLSGYVFKDNDDTHVYTLPAGTVVAAGAYYVLEEAAFGFGLGAQESVRLYLPGGTTLVDSYSWTAHATTSYGRCPNGTGAFGTSLTSTKGAANDCGSSGGSGGAGGTGGTGGASGGAGGTSGGSGGAPAAYLAWPGGNAVVTVDVANTFPSNLSSLFYEPAQGSSPAVLWGALNGPSKIYRLLDNGSNWVPDLENGWAAGKSLHYSTGLGSPDSEGITKAAFGTSGLYVSTERDNEASSVSKLVVALYDQAGIDSTISAVKDWNLTADIPATGANLGLEGITWVPDAYLVSKGFIDESKNAAYDPALYPNHAGGIFFVGVEGSGIIYGYALDHVGGGFTRVATVLSGNVGVMDVAFDRDNGYLWAICDDSCQGRTNVLDVDTRLGSPTRGKFYIRQGFERPSTMPNINNEGFAITSEATCVGGFKSVFYADDGNTSGHAIRRDSIPCGPFLL